MKKILIGVALLCASIAAQAQFTYGELLTSAALNAEFALMAQLSGATFTGPVTVPSLTVLGTVNATSVATPSATIGTATLSNPLSVGNGGTGTATASGTALDNITGFSGTGIISRTGAGAYSFGSVPPSSLSAQAANTALANATGSSASPTAVALPSCSTGNSALKYTTSSGFSCGTTFGLTSAGLNQFASTTSAQLASVISDETGSGSATFATSPTLTTPHIASIVNTGTLTLPTSTDTLVGRATTDTLTNKTLTSPTVNTATISGGTVNSASVGATTASTGAFTTLSASSTVSGTGFSTYLASPPAIGGTTAAAGAFTTLSATTANPSLIYKASGTGSVNRTYLSKLSDHVNVVDYGADPTGAADSEAATAAAIASLPNGGIVDFPAGTFEFNTTLANTTNNITLRCAQLGTTIQPGASMTSLISNTGVDFSVQGCSLSNASSFATNGILSTISSSSAAMSAWIHDNFIVGFTNGISASGQNYTITRNWFQNNTTHILFSNDGRNTTINDNYILGGAIGIHFAITSQQAEGTRVINNTILATGGSGAGIQFDAGLADVVMGNIIDQTGASSPGIYANITGSNALAKLHIIGNWIAAGQNSYSTYFAGNTADIALIGNDIVSNNALAATAGISMNSTNGVKIIGNDFGIVTGPDLSLSGISNQTILGNTSNQGSSNAIANYFSQASTFGTTTTANGLIIPTSSIGIQGTSAGDNAQAGSFGEYACAQVTNGGSPTGCSSNVSTPISLTNNTAANVTSLSLAAGDWEVCANIAVNFSGQTGTSAYAGISTTSATFPNSTQYVGQNLGTTTMSGRSQLVCTPRLNVTSTTVVYAVAQGGFASGTATAFGYMWARRQR